MLRFPPVFIELDGTPFEHAAGIHIQKERILIYGPRLGNLRRFNELYTRGGKVPLRLRAATPKWNLWGHLVAWWMSGKYGVGGVSKDKEHAILILVRP